MKTLPISRYRFFQKIQPLSLFKKIANKSFTGCLQVFTPAGSWSIYTDEGNLVYACHSEAIFEPIYRHLQHLSEYVTTLPHDINQQLQAIFEVEIQNKAIPNPDYLAICWLVNQKYLTSLQAELLIEQLALEVLDSFLGIDEGSYEFIPDSFLDDLPKFCQLDLGSLIEKSRRGSKVSYEQFYASHPPQPPTYRYPSASTKPTHQKPFTIFCINDTPLGLDTINSYLDEQIFSVIGVREAHQALMEVLHIQPDLILLDVTIPNLDGYELCSLLRKNTRFKKTPVIMVTSKINLIDRAKAKIVKASGSLPKPFTQGDLLKTIFQHIVP